MEKKGTKRLGRREEVKRTEVDVESRLDESCDDGDGVDGIFREVAGGAERRERRGGKGRKGGRSARKSQLSVSFTLDALLQRLPLLPQ